MNTTDIVNIGLRDRLTWGGGKGISTLYEVSSTDRGTPPR
jgi:hypothetical protein